MKFWAILSASLLIASPALAGSPVTINDKTNTYSATVDSSHDLHVTCDSGCSGTGGTSSTFGATFPSTGTAIGVKNGANMTNLTGDGSNNLNVDIAAGVAIGVTGSAVKTSSDLIGISDGTNQQPLIAPISLGDGVNGNNSIAAGLYLYNGTTWDRARDDSNKYLYSDVGAINGVTPLMGQGATGTGSQRVTVADVNSSASVSVSTATTTQIIAASGSTVIHVKQWTLVTTLADNVTWESADTGGACANPVALTGAMPFGANGGAAVGAGSGDVLVLPAGKALCMVTSAATQISGSVAYSQY